MIKILLLSALAGLLVLVLLRSAPKLRTALSRLLQNPLFRRLILRGIWRVIRLLIFRR